MATVHTAKPQHHVRTRSTSDPFSDPVYPTTTHRIAQVPRSAPAQTPSKPQRPPKPATESSRTKMHRSQTSVPSHPQDVHSPQSKRSVSQDSVVRTATSLEKNKNHGRRSAKKGSMHADVIDRLDFSGVGPMFHHDGPFDACAPSRNRHTNKAPMLAWGADSAAQDDAALARARHADPVQSPRGERNQYTSPVIPYEPKKVHDALAEAWGIHEPEPFEEFSAGGGVAHSRGSTRGNTPIASSFPGGATPTGRRSREHAPPPSSAGAANAVASRQGRREKRALPPPQPIFVGDDEQFVPQAASDPDSAPASPTSPGAPKRSKSLMQRIRKMRDNPNVPAGATQDGYYYESDTAATPQAERPTRPTHRSQRSFLGRIGSGGPVPAPVYTSRGARDESMSPRSEKSADAFVYVEKDLPAAPGSAGTPRSPGENAYFDESYNGVNGGATGLGRKTSLMKRAKGLMRGGK